MGVVSFTNRPDGDSTCLVDQKKFRRLRPCRCCRIYQEDEGYSVSDVPDLQLSAWCVLALRCQTSLFHLPVITSCSHHYRAVKNLSRSNLGYSQYGCPLMREILQHLLPCHDLNYLCMFMSPFAGVCCPRAVSRVKEGWGAFPGLVEGHLRGKYQTTRWLLWLPERMVRRLPINRSVIFFYFWNSSCTLPVVLLHFTYTVYVNWHWTHWDSWKLGKLTYLVCPRPLDHCQRSFLKFGFIHCMSCDISVLATHGWFVHMPSEALQFSVIFGLLAPLVCF